MISYRSEKHKLQFSHIPKSGCQSVRKFLLQINEENINIDIWSKEFEKKYIIRTTNTLSGYKHYSLTRNPYSRIVSCYFNKIVGVNWDKFKRHFRRKYIGTRPTFREFIIRLNQGILNANEHWTPQHKLINNQNTKIFKLEDKESIDNEMLKETGFKFTHFKARHHMHNVFDSDHFVGDKSYEYLVDFFNSSSQPIYKNFFDEEIKSIVFNLYELDFINFSYSKNL